MAIHRSLAVGTSLGLHFYDTQILQLIRFIQTDTWLCSVAYSPVSNLLATGSYDNTVRLWNPETGDLLQSLNGHMGWVRSVIFSPDVPVPLNLTVIEAVQGNSRPSITPVWQPELSAQLRDRLALIGINAAQIITFVTYLLALLSLVGLPLGGLLWWVKNHPLRK